MTKTKEESRQYSRGYNRGSNRYHGFALKALEIARAYKSRLTDFESNRICKTCIRWKRGCDSCLWGYCSGDFDEAFGDKMWAETFSGNHPAKIITQENFGCIHWLKALDENRATPMTNNPHTPAATAKSGHEIVSVKLGLLRETRDRLHRVNDRAAIERLDAAIEAAEHHTPAAGDEMRERLVRDAVYRVFMRNYDRPDRPAISEFWRAIEDEINRVMRATTLPAPARKIDRDQLKHLDEFVTACEEEFTGPSTVEDSDDDPISAGRDANDNPTYSPITFGHIRRARRAILSLLTNTTGGRDE